MEEHKSLLAAMTYNWMKTVAAAIKDILRSEEKFIQCIVNICLSSDN